VQFADSRQGALWASRKAVFFLNKLLWNSKSPASTPEQAAEKVDLRCPAPKGASDFQELTVSLRRYRDTNRRFFAACEGVFV